MQGDLRHEQSGVTQCILRGHKEPVPCGWGVLNYSCWEYCLPQVDTSTTSSSQGVQLPVPTTTLQQNWSVQGEPRHLNTHPGEEKMSELLRAVWPHGFGPVAHSYPTTSDRKPLTPSSHYNTSWKTHLLPSQIIHEAEVNFWINMYIHCTYIHKYMYIYIFI